jgi:2-polyprenyl-3-methyl-5-hydroxy-6-metoxy-1,4-benzoquinol methylase
MSNETGTHLTDKAYWDRSYEAERVGMINVDGFRGITDAIILDRISSLIAPGSRVLEIGAGDSPWLPFLAGRIGNAHFTGLDYSELGCERLRRRATDEGVPIEVICADMFSPDPQLLGRFDVLISFGVVEHFLNLAEVMTAFRRFLVPAGRVFTLIPNMAGSIGAITRWLDRSVYERHVAHTTESLVEGHRAGGFVIDQAGYLGSVNFGVLSAAAARERRLRYQAYVAATRVSKAVNLVEHATGFSWPTSRTFSPYIACVASAGVDAACA